MQIGRHLILKHRDKPDVNAELFDDYLPSVFLPHLLITRLVKDLREGDAVLLMDNCLPHITLAVVELLSTARVRVVVVTFAPQPDTIQIFHVLALTLFSVLQESRGEDQNNENGLRVWTHAPTASHKVRRYGAVSGGAQPTLAPKQA
jgi:hypothetical protein